MAVARHFRWKVKHVISHVSSALTLTSCAYIVDHPDKMNSISPECQELKEKYDACFNKWFSEKYLKGNTKDECSGLFEVYQECVKVCFYSLHVH